MDQIAGHIIRMTKSNGQLLTCSLWLRQQETQGRHILIWIFELIDELYITLELNQDQITKAEGQTMNMFGYHEDELVDCPVSLLIPHLESPIDWNVCNIKKYYTGQSHRGVTFPVWIHKDQNTLKIRSLPNMAGCLVIDTHGLVTSINNVFSKNLFGISSQEMQQMQVSHLLPDFWDFFNSRSPKTLYYDDLDKGRMTSPLEMKSPIGLFPTHRRITMLTNRKDTSPMTLGTAMVAKHRDGTEIQVNVHIRPCSGTMIGFHLVWIAFNHHEYHGVRLSASPTPDDLPDSLQQLDLSRKARESQSRDSLKELPRTPPKRWQFYESLGLFQMQDLIGDFKILSDIGEGAYGYVKLGVSKKDPFKNKVVLKYVVKSKVLNWCRRPDIGGRVPLEASTMFDISSIPHPNVCRLLTMFQDEFFFYILMPYEPTMDLFDYIETRDIPQEDIRTIFAQVVSGLQHLHKNGIVHRDIKASRVRIG
ncbi:kinase-like domain-containing protein [Gorgonomyces haynaldii]|nr:kinase-like domain-containing protein [Gorgonomyces haynaldii]